jgi:hypothetical protein
MNGSGRETSSLGKGLATLYNTISFVHISLKIYIKEIPPKR